MSAEYTVSVVPLGIRKVSGEILVGVQLRNEDGHIFSEQEIDMTEDFADLLLIDFLKDEDAEGPSS